MRQCDGEEVDNEIVKTMECTTEHGRKNGCKCTSLQDARKRFLKVKVVVGVWEIPWRGCVVAVIILAGVRKATLEDIGRPPKYDINVYYDNLSSIAHKAFDIFLIITTAMC